MARSDMARQFIEYTVVKAKANAVKDGTAFRTPISMLSRHDVAAWLKTKSWYSTWSYWQLLQEATEILQAARRCKVKFAGVYCLNRKSHGAGTVWEIVRETQAKKMASQYVGEAKDVLYRRLDDRVAVAASNDPKVIATVERIKESIEYGLGVLDRLMGVA